MRIFLVSHVVPYPPAHGIEFRILQTLRWLRQSGMETVLILPVSSLSAEAAEGLSELVHEVKILPGPPPSEQAEPRRAGIRHISFEFVFRCMRYALRFLRGICRRIIYTASMPKHYVFEKRRSKSELLKEAERRLCPSALVALVEQLAKEQCPDAIIIQGVFLSACCDVVPPGLLKLIDTIDMFSRRAANVHAHGIPEALNYSANEERERLLCADVIIAIQTIEAELFRALVPERKVICVGVDFEGDVMADHPDQERDVVAVIGSDNAANIHGLHRFLDECWPLVAARQPTATLRVFGKLSAHCRSDLPSVKPCGWVADVRDVYSRATVMVNPTIAGTGLKIKSAEALAFGKPLVAWKNGVEGLESADEPPFLACADPAEFADAVVSLLSSRELREKLSARAIEFARVEFTADRAYAPLAAVLKEHKSGKRTRSQNFA